MVEIYQPGAFHFQFFFKKNSLKNGAYSFISAGLFDDELGIKPRRHIFVGDKCSWFDITDNIPQEGAY